MLAFHKMPGNLTQPRHERAPAHGITRQEAAFNRQRAADYSCFSTSNARPGSAVRP